MAPTGRVLEVWNKADRLSAAARIEVGHAMARSESSPVLVSAVTGEGVERLRQAIDARLGANDVVLTVEVPAAQGRLLELAACQRRNSEGGDGGNGSGDRHGSASIRRPGASSRANSSGPALPRATPSAPGRARCESKTSEHGAQSPKKRPHLREGDGVRLERHSETENHQSARRRSRPSHVRLALADRRWTARSTSEAPSSAHATRKHMNAACLARFQSFPFNCSVANRSMTSTKALSVCVVFTLSNT